MSPATLTMRLRVPLDEFALDVDCETERRVVGLFGPSGSGKTTWLEAIAGLREGAEGFVRCGDAIWLDSAGGVDLPPEERGIGYVPQDHLLFPHRSVRQNLRAGEARARRAGHDVEARFAEVASVLRLAPLLDRPVSSLSGGERQRVALGRALCSGPRLLMLDEPLASLDVHLRHRILPFLLEVRDAFEIPILVVSHNPMELRALCDEVVALDRGRVLAQGDPIEVFTRSDVYGAAAAEGFENSLPARVVGHGEHITQLRLGVDGEGQPVSILRIDRAVGERLLLGVAAHEILVATRRVTGLSARNCLEARLTALEEVGHKQVLTARLAESDKLSVVIELTRDAIDELTPAEGDRIWLLIKSASIEAYG